MLEKIIIPTHNRINKQKTYDCLPQKWKDITVFVVQASQYQEMCEAWGEDKVISLPEDITTIAPTREWIFHNLGQCRHIVFDDDLTFRIRQPVWEDPNDGKFKTFKWEEQHFDEAFAEIDEWMDQGIIFGGLLETTTRPSKKSWPHHDVTRICTNVFYDGTKVPKNIEWTRVTFAEDFDVTLQLLSRGTMNRVNTKYCVQGSATNSKGGCSEYRTLELQNESQQTLADLWPGYIRVTERTMKTGPWKGQVKKGVTISWKKIFRDAV